MILVVEQDPARRRRVAETLARAGLECRLAADAAEGARLLAAAGPPPPDGAAADPFAALVAESPAAAAAVVLARRAAGAEIPVLLEGESGVGKEVAARAVHAASRRAGGPFVAVNCGALPETLVESILFGHERGAFTGAVGRHDGKFVEAGGGVLFLDEIGELPAPAQVKLLRALQSREVDPVGAARPRPVDIRLISATNRDLAAEVAAGRFRPDLFYRLSAFPIRLAPLRDRREDIPPLVERLLDRLAAAEGRARPALTAPARARLLAHHWPGNVRELENALHRAMVLAGAGPIEPSHLDAPGAPAPAPDAAPAAAGDAHLPPLAAVEAAHIRAALDRYDGRIAETARRLGVGRSTLYRKMAELGLAPARAPAA
jgi:DNA-binding NtrC family response regulator